MVGRTPVAGTDFRLFDLEDPKLLDLEGVQAVIHAAHDFSASGPAIVERNLGGGEAVLESAIRAHARPVIVSTLSAFDGCRSRYGRVKRQLEERWAAQGGIILRAGVVFGKDAGGIFGALRDVIRWTNIVPLVAPRSTPFYATYDRSLADALLNAATSNGSHPSSIALAANPEPFSFAHLIEHIASGTGRRIHLIPVPPHLAYLSLATAERLGITPPFRSDSVLSLLRPVPPDQLARLPLADSTFPPLDTLLWASDDKSHPSESHVGPPTQP